MTGDPRCLLTKERLDRICELISTTGCTIKAAAAATGCSPWTVYDWLNRGRKEQSGPYWECLQAIEAAKDQSELVLLQYVLDAAPKDWRAAEFLLKSRFPDAYGDRRNLARELERMSDAELDAFIARQLGNAAGERQIGPGGAHEAPREGDPAVIDADFRPEGPA